LIYFDSETCGFTGPMVLLQYAENDGPIQLHHIWHEPIPKTLRLLEWLCADDVCGFNLTFDWFHTVKIYNLLRALYDGGYRDLPTVNAVARVDSQNYSRYCLKPQAALDIMLVARRDKYQHAMRRKDIVIRRVPGPAAAALQHHLNSITELPDICFAKDPEGCHWRIRDNCDLEDDIVYKDVYLRFAPSTGLHALSQEILGEDKADWPIPKDISPTELMWKPYGVYGTRPWTSVIEQHIGMWWANEKAKYYARRDVDLTRRLRLEGFADAHPGDTDSELAIAVGAARWRGFEIDKERVSGLIPGYKEEMETAPHAPHAAMRWLERDMDEAETLVIKDTQKATLERLAETGSNEAVRSKAQAIIDARKARNRHTMLNRLLEVERLNPDFKIIGTKSNRQAGGSDDEAKGGSINPQGIPRDAVIRQCFPFAREDEQLWGGDAVSCQVTIIDAVLPDPRLHEELKSGKSFHALMGQIWYDVDYAEMAQAKADADDDRYDRAKQADFALAFGAMGGKLAKVLGMEEEKGDELVARGHAMYPDMFRQREEIAMMFCSMRQDGGLGTKVEWHEPAEYIDSLFGFKRYFTMENYICRMLFDLANKPPKAITDAVKGLKCKRRDREQTVAGAMQSSLYAAAFGLQAINMRAACNHIIQSPEGYITKEFQRALWDEQPCGVAGWRIRTFNVHDELMCVTDGTVDTTAIRDRTITKFREKVPLLQWEWDKLNTWGDK
jgi:hypothetical protein